ncbi:MAG: hypothetical protein M1840_006962 [Geoglossum simile]|nr:MAG: hypothetical protein M1840_006962 [Geoglossum simile]
MEELPIHKIQPYPVCYQCGEAQDSKATLFRHLALQHPSSQPKNETDTNTKTNGALPASMDVKPYCRVCERTFSTVGGLGMHTRTSKEHKAKTLWDQAPAFINQTGATQSPVPNECRPIPEAPNDDPTRIIINGVSKIELGASQCGGGDSPKKASAEASKFKYGSNYWSIIATAQRSAALHTLLEYCQKEEHLEGRSYRIRPYDANNISGLCICLNCDKERQYILKTGTENECISHAEKPWCPSAKTQHDLCCKTTTSTGCKRLDVHNYADLDPGVEEKWQPYIQCPAKGTNARKAVALDCEMAGVNRESELVLLSVVDYLTGEVLINNFVRPTRHITDWRTRWSGVTPRAMARAVSKGEALDGWKGARTELFRYIDADTIVIGHALHHDLDELKVLHTRVIDSAVLAQSVVGSSRQLGLKSLCSSLGIYIQSNGRRGHDCLEDALATREFTLRCLNKPRTLARWAEAERRAGTDNIEELKREVEELKRQEKRELEERRQEKEREEEEERRKAEELRKEEEGWTVQRRRKGQRRIKF